MKQPKVRSISIVYLIIFILCIALIVWIYKAKPAPTVTPISPSTLVTMSQADRNQINYGARPESAYLSALTDSNTPVIWVPASVSIRFPG